jgi:hypothetical protein
LPRLFYGVQHANLVAVESRQTAGCVTADGATVVVLCWLGLASGPSGQGVCRVQIGTVVDADAKPVYELTPKPRGDGAQQKSNDL